MEEENYFHPWQSIVPGGNHPKQGLGGSETF